MNSAQSLRLWPGVALVTLQWLLRYPLPALWPEAVYVGVIGSVICGLGVVVWWLFFSRAERLVRWGAIPFMAAALALTYRLVDKSISGGMMGLMIVIYSIPLLSLVLVGWALWSRKPAVLAALVLLVCGGWTLLRTEGMRGGAKSDLAWRWSATKEDVLLQPAHRLPPPPPPAASAEAAKPTEPVAEPAKPIAAPIPVLYAGFRGAERDSVIPSLQIATDWNARKPAELWRQPVGPGWSSFALQGEMLYTQEQRGEEELVACYDARTGKLIWAHRDPVRFWESNAGAGPRGTPAIADGRVYAFGATGILNALDAQTGAKIWSRNVAKETDTATPGWGFSSSPLVLGDLVYIAASGKLAAYARNTGEKRWANPTIGGSYSSPHLYLRNGEPQILLMGQQGVRAVVPATGETLWTFEWKAGTRIVQPAILPDGDLLISGGDGDGVKRLGVTRTGGAWKVEEKWLSNGLKPYFNDFVVHNGHAYGFDGSILACIDLNDGKRKWKGGRYGHGQMVLLREQNVLLVLSEEGELALVQAAPDGFQELARIPAIEGKTWNHPIVATGRLFIRNGSEMAAYQLAAEQRRQTQANDAQRTQIAQGQ